ncbi:hypothetical protein [Epidermidibacterium keratini]|nr:hypothetical protein [Epidermidibacterium keratini]
MRRTTLKLTTVTAMVGLSSALFLGTPAEAAPKAQSPGTGQVAQTTLPVTGTLADGSSFTGAISGLTASVVNGVAQVTGTITGTGLPVDGTTFTAPIESLNAPQGCDVLNLDLGPLNLDLLGLVIDLSPISLDITAVPGAGNLLGNLVCAVAGLLDGGGPLQGITALLNRLLTGLGL